MVERVKGKIALPLNAAEAAEAKAGRNVSSTVPIIGSEGAEAFVKSSGALVIRSGTIRAGHRPFAKASAMKACHGKRGCEFMSCIEAAGITAPRSVVKACRGGATRAEYAGAGVALRGLTR